MKKNKQSWRQNILNKYNRKSKLMLKNNVFTDDINKFRSHMMSQVEIVKKMKYNENEAKRQSHARRYSKYNTNSNSNNSESDLDDIPSRSEVVNRLKHAFTESRNRIYQYDKKQLHDKSQSNTNKNQKYSKSHKKYQKYSNHKYSGENTKLSDSHRLASKRKDLFLKKHRKIRKDIQELEQLFAELNSNYNIIAGSTSSYTNIDNMNNKNNKDNYDKNIIQWSNELQPLLNVRVVIACHNKHSHKACQRLLHKLGADISVEPISLISSNNSSDLLVAYIIATTSNSLNVNNPQLSHIITYHYLYPKQRILAIIDDTQNENVENDVDNIIQYLMWFGITIAFRESYIRTISGQQQLKNTLLNMLMKDNDMNISIKLLEDEINQMCSNSRCSNVQVLHLMEFLSKSDVNVREFIKAWKNAYKYMKNNQEIPKQLLQYFIHLGHPFIYDGNYIL